MPKTPKRPKPGIRSTSVATNKAPAPTRRRSSQPASPRIKCEPKNRDRESAPASPASPKVAVLTSTTIPRNPSDNRNGATTGFEKNRTNRSAQFTPKSVTSAPATPSSSSKVAKSSVSVAYPMRTASSVVNVRSRPASTTPGTASDSSTIASAIAGSSPRASASARISLRIAETIFSGAFVPAPSTGVTAPTTDPGRMYMPCVARAIKAPAENARRFTKA